MYAELLVLRLIHILSAIAWVGSGIFTSFFLVPAISASPGVLMQVMAGLRRRRFFVILPIVGTLTILSGLRLLWIDSAGFAGSYFDSATGKAFSWGGLAAIIAYIIAYGVALPINLRLAKIVTSMTKSAAGAEREGLTADMNRLSRRAAGATLAAVLFGLLAASAMAVARYL
jgi:uncharacterized membrane protein